MVDFLFSRSERIALIRGAAMQQIADWLKKLGLSEYAQRFAENHVDFSVLPELTDQDLKDLGIVLGDRRKLLRAIADLNGIEKIQSKPTEAATTPVAPQPQDSAERRQVSVMFADLVGSTALSARMDPEDLREIISAYQICVTETVRRLGGFVAKYMGDGVLVYFGYPQAHEDDAERAVRAGLELIAAVSASARRRTSRLDCKGSPSRTRWSSPRARDGSLAICSNSTTSHQETSRASPGRFEPGRHCERVRWKAASRRSTRPNLPL